MALTRRPFSLALAITAGGLPTSADTLTAKPIDRVSSGSGELLVREIQSWTITAGTLPVDAEIVAPANYRFTLLKQGRPLFIFDGAIADAPGPITLAEVYAITGDAVAVDPALIHEGDNLARLVLIGGDETMVVGFDEDGNIIPVAKGEAASVPWAGVTDKPTTFPSSAHTHDDRYYTETEIDGMLAGLGGGAGGAPEVAMFSDEKPAFTNGGATDGTVQTRILNTVDIAQSWASLAANTVTLQPGTYSFRYCVTAWNRFMCGYLRNVTAGTYLQKRADHCGSASRIERRWHDVPPVTFAVATDIQVRMWGENSAGDDTAMGQLIQGGPDGVPTKFCILIVTKWA
jgi:hypothetical protein